MEATLRGNILNKLHASSNGYNMYWLYVLYILGPEVWNPLLEEITILQFTPVVLLTTYMGLTKSRNMEATFRGNHIDILSFTYKVR